MERKPDSGGNAGRFGIALVLIVATIISLPLADLGSWARVVSVALAGCTLLFTLHTASAKQLTMGVALLIVVVGLAASILALAFGSSRVAVGAPAFVGALLAVVAPIAIIRRLLAETTVTGHTVAGALCLYLLVGLFFAFVYALVGAIDPPFFVEVATQRTADHVYFSFVTLTTTGYGDFTARSSAGRMLAISEALIGQLYLVSVVAVLVSNLGRERKRR